MDSGTHTGLGAAVLSVRRHLMSLTDVVGGVEGRQLLQLYSQGGV